jgi:hypothetical protein
MFLAPTRFKIYSFVIIINHSKIIGFESRTIEFVSKTIGFVSKMIFFKRNLEMALKLRYGSLWDSWKVEGN